MTTDTRLTAREAAEKAVKYWNLKEAERLLNEELEPLNKELRQYIEETGEPIRVEGQPDLELLPRATATKYDVRSFAENEPLEFQRALEAHGLTFNAKIMRDLADAGQLSKIYEQYGHAGSTLALAFSKKVKR